MAAVAPVADNELLRSNTASRMPTFRGVQDLAALRPGPMAAASPFLHSGAETPGAVCSSGGHHGQSHDPISHARARLDHDDDDQDHHHDDVARDYDPAVSSPPHTQPLPPLPPPHSRSISAIAPSAVRPSPLRPQTFSGFAGTSSPLALDAQRANASRTAKTRKVPASNSRNDLDEQYWNGPPPAMITQKSFPSSTTQDWVASIAQQSPPAVLEHPPPSPAQHSPSSRSSSELTRSRTAIKPIRGFKTSARRSAEMASQKRHSIDPDSTLRAVEGYGSQQIPGQGEQEEQNSDGSDLFLRAAREEELAQHSESPRDRGLTRSEKRRSTTSQRTSLPLPYNSSISRRRGSDHDHDTQTGERPIDEQEVIGQALNYRTPSRDRPLPVDDTNRSRFYGSNLRLNPATPRGTYGTRETSPELQTSPGARRPSIPEPSFAAKTSSYRQSNLSYSTPRTYNSSPLVSRSTDVQLHETPETQRAMEGTNSTVSTTAPSTVWDELDDLKSRIHRLELTGKLPSSSGAAISRASNERPATATTTVTTMSSSPKRERHNSISPNDMASFDSQGEAHPLLHSALAKSKSLLNAETYKALEATAVDALAIASMMGNTGQSRPMSSSYSTVGGSTPITDRQVRRKADSLCRGLTELCLALSEGKNENVQSAQHTGSHRPTSRDTDNRQSIELSNNSLQGMNNELARIKSSPRALSRLEARRSSLLAGGSLQSPRYTHSESNTPTQSSMAGRRTSLLLRSRRAGADEPEEEDESRFRAPSRATTEIGRARNSPREYVSQQPLPERTPSMQSSLPVRRHYASNSLTNSSVPSVPPVSSLGGRRYIERSTPDRETNSNSNRLIDDHAQRKSSIGQGFALGRTGSLTRRTRQQNSADLSSAGQIGGY